MRLCIVMLGILTTSAAAQPRLSNAKMQTRTVTAGLDREMQSLIAQPATAWIGYAAPGVAGHQLGCSSWALEGGRATLPDPQAGPVRLEGGGSIMVLYRIEQGRIDKIRALSSDCELDAGGLPFHWLNGVPSTESIAFLATLVTDERRRADSAISAIALHGDSSADVALEKLVAAGQPDAVREKAAFWFGSARGRRGFEVLRRLVTEDSSDHLREKAIFALSVSKEPEAVRAIVEVAKKDKSPRVRGQALFWLAHKAGKRETSAITDAIDNDPDTEVKKKAVFALSQLPKDEGIPLLIRVARTNSNPVARKQAMFWLGQSRDSRALQFFEEILK